MNISKNGQPSTDYRWDEKTKTFSSDTDGLVIDMSDMDGVTIKCGWNSTIRCGGNSTITAEGNYVVVTRWDCEDFYRLDNQTIKTNGYGIVGYKSVDEKKVITIDGKDIEISKESYEALVKGLMKEAGE